MELITSENYEEKIKSGIVVVDFSAKWCGPCNMLEPVLFELSQQMKDVQFYQVDIDHDKTLSLDQGVRGVPTLFLYKDGELIARTMGYSPKEVLIPFIERAK